MLVPSPTQLLISAAGTPGGHLTSVSVTAPVRIEALCTPPDAWRDTPGTKRPVTQALVVGDALGLGVFDGVEDGVGLDDGVGDDEAVGVGETVGDLEGEGVRLLVSVGDCDMDVVGVGVTSQLEMHVGLDRGT